MAKKINNTDAVPNSMEKAMNGNASINAGIVPDPMEEPMTNKSTTVDEAETDKLTTEQWLAIRKEAGLKIDPKTAEVEWTFALTLDPYGVLPELPEEYQQVGRAYFARSPGSDIWVWFGDLPRGTLEAMSARAMPSFSLGAPRQVRPDEGELDDAAVDAALDAHIAEMMRKAGL